MDDLQLSLPQPNSSSISENPSAICADRWWQGEQITQKIIWQIQPTKVSEERRREVIAYIQNLITGALGCVVYPFGSVPLKTYLSHGDIDLTAFGAPNSESSLANDVRAVLEGEEKNEAAEFEVKDVQYIHAEVKLVKCLVQNIVVDISFNQIGGLCTVCFLEKIDQLIGKDHLFKRSIILIKAWCYYESRILGAHHGLISTYALETLVLYIFHFFHSSLDGPLSVLYRFLDYFGKFDWDKYCISLHGPVTLSSLLEIGAKEPDTDRGDLLLSPENFKQCEDLYSVPLRRFENNSNSRMFFVKHLNIVDPLKENNNLGRSVSKGSFYRIRSAFTYGARKLGRILLLPGDCLANELNQFFENTLDRHGSGERPDMQASANLQEVSGVNGASVVCHDGLCEDVNRISISSLENENETGICLGKQPCNHQLSDGLPVVNSVSGMRLAGDATDLATSRSTNGICNPSSTSSEAGKNHGAPHHLLCQENGKIGNGNPDQLKTTKYGGSMNTMPCASDEDTSLVSGKESWGVESSSNNTPQFCINHRMLDSTSWLLARNKGVQESEFNESELVAKSELLEASALSDLAGDYDTHFANLHYVQTVVLNFEYSSSGPTVPVQPPSPQFQNNSWVAFPQGKMFPHMNANGVVPRPPFSSAHGYIPMNPAFIPGSYGMEDISKPRGTGTYFPNTNYHSYGDNRQLPRPRNNGRIVTPSEKIRLDKGGQESLPWVQLPASNGNGRGKSTLLELTSQAPVPASSGFSVANGFTFLPERRLEFGSFGSIPISASLQESDRKLESGQGYAAILLSSANQRPGTSSNGERVTQLYRLKDEDDFPPLSEKKGR